MSQRSAQILKEALSLPSDERADLAERILTSLDLSPDQEIDRLWAQEAENRLDAFQRNEIPSASAKDVFDSLLKRKG